MKRGRPKTKLYEKDFGTPELQAKRNNQQTSEALDLCLEKRLISSEQHSAGIRLRWLYTLIFGPPVISGYDPSDLGGKFQSKYNDDNWLKSKKVEYIEAIEGLKSSLTINIVMNTCIFNQYPKFLINNSIQIDAYKDLSKLQLGLDIIDSVFKTYYKLKIKHRISHKSIAKLDTSIEI
jgi:hypothetical protein